MRQRIQISNSDADEINFYIPELKAEDRRILTYDVYKRILLKAAEIQRKMLNEKSDAEITEEDLPDFIPRWTPDDEAVHEAFIQMKNAKDEKESKEAEAKYDKLYKARLSQWRMPLPKSATCSLAIRLAYTSKLPLCILATLNEASPVVD